MASKENWVELIPFLGTLVQASREMKYRVRVPSRKDVLRILGLSAIGALLAACGPKGDKRTATDTPIPPTKIPDRITKTAIPSKSPEFESSSTSTPQPDVLQRPEENIDSASGGKYPDALWNKIETGGFAAQEKIIRDYWDYWSGADKPAVYPLRPDEELEYEYKYDPNDPTKAWVAVNVQGREYFVVLGGKKREVDLLSVPWVNGGFAKAAPTKYVDGQVEKGQGPLFFTRNGSDPDGNNWYLSAEGELPVRRDSQTREILERVNAEGVWTEDLTPMRIAKRMGLDTERTYEIQGAYLVDVKNKAKMAKTENGEWVDTTPEEKYGHLAPNGEYFSKVMYYNFFELGSNNPAFESVYINVRSAGNLKVITEYDPNLGEVVDVLMGSVVFRDRGGEIKEIKLRFNIAETGKIAEVYTCKPAKDDPKDWGSQDRVRFSSMAKVINYYDVPGEKMNLSINCKRPLSKPALIRLGNVKWAINLREVANWYDWIANRDQYEELEKTLRDGRNVIIPEGIVVSAERVAVFTTEDVVKNIYNERDS